MNRIEISNKYFTNIEFTSENISLYSVRKSIYNAVQKVAGNFSGRLLDVGCGIMPYKELILSYGKVSEYIGMDLAGSPYHGEVPPNLVWDGTKIPLDDNCIDSVMATEFLEHYHDTQSILKEIHRVLKPGGFLFGTVPFVWNLHEVPYDEYRFTPYSLQKHFSNAGYGNVEINSLGGANAALAQMMGLWWQIQSSSVKYKKVLKKPFFYFYKWLLKKDTLLTTFDGGKNSLYNGLSFIAYKNDV